jgi:hypothetical protein
VPGIRHQWALSLFRQPTDYTALAFNNASALPATAVRDEPVSISFSIANHEGRAISYRYVLTETASGPPTTLQQSSRLVETGGTWTVATSVRPSCPGSRCRIQVSLPGHPETIDFLVTLTSKRAAGG